MAENSAIVNEDEGDDEDAGLDEYDLENYDEEG